MIKRPTDKIAQEYLKPWGISQKLEFVRGVENFVYKTKDGEYFLRLTQPDHRKSDEILAELDWISFLREKGMAIAEPVVNQNNNFIEIFPFENKSLSAVIFKKAKGRCPDQKIDFEFPMLHNWGQYLGQLHKYTQSYQGFERLHWNQEPGFILAEQSLNRDDQHFHVYQQLKEYLFQLPKDKNCYGLIHADLHMGNFFVDEKYDITAFDFDDSQNHWLIYDMAVVVASLKTFFNRKKWDFDYEKLWAPFSEGYSSEFELEEEWLKRIPAFVYWRETILYFWLLTRIKNNDFLKVDEKRVLELKDWLSHSLLSFSPTVLC